MRKKIAILESNIALGMQLKEALEESGEITVMMLTDDGEDGLKGIFKEEPDLAFVGMFLKSVDGCGVIREMKKKGLKTKIIATGVSNDGVVERAILEGADYYIVKPFSIVSALERANEMLIEKNADVDGKEFSGVKKKTATTDEKISEIFISIGIPPHIKGYGYLREGIKTTVEKPYIINNVTKELYPTIARKFDTSPSKVERAIRHAIEVAWNRGNVDTISQIFSYTISYNKSKPTNSEFIAMIADKLRLAHRVGVSRKS